MINEAYAFCSFSELITQVKYFPIGRYTCFAIAIEDSENLTQQNKQPIPADIVTSSFTSKVYFTTKQHRSKETRGEYHVHLLTFQLKRQHLTAEVPQLRNG